MITSCSADLLGASTRLCNFLFWGGGGGVGVGIKSKQGALWPMWKWWTHYFAAHSALQIISLFCGICQYGLGSFSIEKKYILSLLWGWLLVASTFYINHKHNHFGAASSCVLWWLLLANNDERRGWATKGKSTDFRLSELGISQIAFRALLLQRHSVGMGRREPWERGWESPLLPFYFYFAYQLPS